MLASPFEGAFRALRLGAWEGFYGGAVVGKCGAWMEHKKKPRSFWGRGFGDWVFWLVTLVRVFTGGLFFFGIAGDFPAGFLGFGASLGFDRAMFFLGRVEKDDRGFGRFGEEEYHGRFR